MRVKNFFDEAIEAGKHVLLILVADGIVLFIGEIFSLSHLAQLIIIGSCTIIGFLVFFIQKYVKRLENKIDDKIEELTFSVTNPNIVDYLHELDADGCKYPYPYSYELVSQEATIDSSGNYKGVYTHKAVNDSDQVFTSYNFHLVTSDRMYFHDLHVQAWITLDNIESIATVHATNNDNALRKHHLIVHFPRAVGLQQQFGVRLAFTLPNALKTGQDGDAIDIGRFKAVTQATMKLTFETPVQDSAWYWLNNEKGRVKKLQLWPWQPSSDQSGRVFALTLPPAGKQMSMTVYAFFCRFNARGDTNGQFSTEAPDKVD